MGISADILLRSIGNVPISYDEIVAFYGDSDVCDIDRIICSLLDDGIIEKVPFYNRYKKFPSAGYIRTII